jgi:hypothetical protein
VEEIEVVGCPFEHYEAISDHFGSVAPEGVVFEQVAVDGAAHPGIGVTGFFEETFVKV